MSSSRQMYSLQLQKFHFRLPLDQWIIFVPLRAKITLVEIILLTLIFSSRVDLTTGELKSSSVNSETITNVTPSSKLISPSDLFMADGSGSLPMEGESFLLSPPSFKSQSLISSVSNLNALSLNDFDISTSLPRFTHIFNEKTIDPGSRLSLKCEATGNPLPQITWMLDSNAIFEHSRIRVGDYVTNNGYVNSFVNITSVRIEDGGLYTCTASNGLHSIRHSSRINVYGLPYVKSMKNLTAISGSRVQIDCPYSGYPIESIVWEKSGQIKLPQNHRQIVFPNGTLVIKKIEKSNDEDTYKCIVNSKVNSNGVTGSKLSSHSSSLYIKVAIAPLISPFVSPPNLREGMRSMLTCSILEGDPPYTFHWFKNDEPIFPHFNYEHGTGKSGQGTSNGIIINHLNSGGGSSTTSRMTVSSTNEFSSTLTINQVSYEDNGNFTCVVTNPAASSNYTVAMVVKVPPKWLVSPTDVESIEGHDLTINCQATGFPQPRIWWEHAQHLPGSSTPTHYQSVISNSHIHALENGSLIVKEVTKKDEGLYLCQATNGVGSGISKVVKLTVRVPPSFRSAFTAITVKKGEAVSIECNPTGEKPISVTWAKDRMHFDPLTDSRYEVTYKDISVANSEGLQVDLKIKSVDRRDSSMYTCTATNIFGKADFNVQVIVQEPPDKVENLLATSIDSRSAVISWTIGYTGNSLITSFQLEYKTSHTKPWSSASSTSESPVQSVSGTANSITLKKLKPLTTYHVRVRAQNGMGWSEFSEILSFTTDEEAPSSPPKNVHVYPLTSRSLQVTWKQPNVDGHNGVIKGYYLGYKIFTSTEPYIFKTITVDSLLPNPSSSSSSSSMSISSSSSSSSSSNSLTGSSNSASPTSSASSSSLDERSHAPAILEVKITDLKRGTKYAVIVQAFNSKGPGPQSDEVVGETMINDPPPAPIVSIGAVKLTTVELTWTFNESYHVSRSTSIVTSSSSSASSSVNLDGSSNLIDSSSVFDFTISGYYLYYKLSHGGWEERQISGQFLTYTFNDLHCGSYYQFYILAYNSVGKGDPSQVVSVRTKGGPPEAPKSVHTFISSNSTAASINLSSWRVNGCHIKNFAIQYKVKYKTSSEWILLSSNVMPEQRIIELVDLIPGTWYSLLVIAHSDAGPTEKEYTFSTLTDNGGTISPLDQIRPLTYSNLNVLIPSACAVIVLTVILIVAFLVICKKRAPHPFDDIQPHHPHHHQHMIHNGTGLVLDSALCSLRGDSVDGTSTLGLPGHRLSNTCPSDAGAILTILDQRKESCLNSNLTSDLTLAPDGTPTKIYFPSPYAMNQLQELHAVSANCKVHQTTFQTAAQQQQQQQQLQHQQHSQQQQQQQMHQSGGGSSQSQQQQAQHSSSNVHRSIDGTSLTLGPSELTANCQGQNGNGASGNFAMDVHHYDTPFPPKWV